MSPKEQQNAFQSGTLEIWRVPEDVEKDYLLMWLDSDQGPNIEITENMLVKTDVSGKWLIKNLAPQNVQQNCS